jgi:probable F420-dependent oxidoreductase
MHVGVYYPATDYTMQIAELAPAVEEGGFESLFVGEHTHIPTSRRSPSPYGGTLPRDYSHFLDPFVALTAAAGQTTTLKLGTCICLITERDPITAAKAVASVDFVSKGRFLLGVGPGWNAEELANHGTDFKSRYRLMRERVLAMKEIWTQEEAQFSGEFVRFDSIWSWPKPIQKPHPPVLLGGNTAHTLRRVVEYCDGWFARVLIGEETIMAGVRELKTLAEQMGRDARTVSTTVYGVQAEPAILDRYRDGGVDRVVLPLPAEDSTVVLSVLDRYAKVRQQWAGR